MILGGSILQLPAIQIAKDDGLDVIVIDMNPKAIGFNVDGVKREIISTTDIDGVLCAAKRHCIDGIMTLASDQPMRTVAYVSRMLDIPGIDEKAALRATNKGYMRDAFRQAGVPSPVFYRVRTKTEYLNAVAKLMQQMGKCIVKPVDSSGSRGVCLIEDEANIDTTYDYSIRHSQSKELVVEEYMEGPEISVESITIKGRTHVIQITDKITTGAPYFVEMGHMQPSRFCSTMGEAIKRVTIDAVRAIGIEDGPSHTEIKITSAGPKVVELGARLGGDCITTHLVPLSTGVSMVEACIRIALNETPDLMPRWNKGAAIKYLQNDSGTIDRIEGLSLAESIPGVEQVSIVHSSGERLEGIHSSSDRAGFVVSQGPDAKAAMEICDRAIKCIKVIIH